MSKFMIVPCIILLLGIRMPMAAETEIEEGSLDGAGGFGIGALVGALVGGPVGALVGAAGGAFFAEQDAAKDKAIGNLEVKLDERESQLTALKSDFEQTQVAMTGEAGILQRRPDAPISLPVFFRTNTATIEESLGPHLARLSAYLKTYPELVVRLEGYSDRRGAADYNLHLSKRRIDTIRRILENDGIAPDRIHQHAYGETRAHAGPADADAMVFDRAVIISIGETGATRA
jgi:outer membrane protein OmpA-like peptidoglycan-associated protein